MWAMPTLLFMIKAILTDIEGTTSSISFVHDVLFPYAYEQIADFLLNNWDNTPVKNSVLEVAKIENLVDYTPQQIIDILREWIKSDRKITPLKDLQGMIWDKGYKYGDFYAHIYPDAYEQLSAWHEENIPIYVYSSGSVQAQKLFFAHTERGNLLNIFSGFYDTKIGQKKETNSYQKIADNLGLKTVEIIFLSDFEAELDAAISVGMKTVWLIREQELFNQQKQGNSVHQIVNNFLDIVLAVGAP